MDHPISVSIYPWNFSPVVQAASKYDVDINLYYHGDEMFDKMLASYDEYIKNETLADSLVEDQNIEKNMELNDIVVGLRVERI